MKKFSKKTLLVILAVLVMVLLTGCQRNTDANGVTLPEKVIYLTTTWKSTMNEGFITALFVWPLAQCINLFAKLTGSPTVSVIIVTLLFALLTLPLTIKSTVQMQKMQMINPKLQEISKKYEGKTDDASRMKQAQELNALYAKYGLNPLGSMLTPFIQFPILIAMYYAVQRADAVVNGYIFGWPFSTTPAAAFKDLAKGWPLVLIFVLMGASQFLSAKIPQWMAERSRKNAKGYKAYADKQQSNATSNVMTISLMAMVVLLGFRWPIAMSLYWLINSTVNTLKTIFVQKRFVENE